MSLPIDKNLQKALRGERAKLAGAKLPIITVSATYRKELIEEYPIATSTKPEVFFSRAHYSMAQAIYQQALAYKIKTHMVDPTNFVAIESWGKVDFTEEVGKLMARNKPLKWLKDKIDTVVRSKLPITDAITPPLLNLIKPVTIPLLSLHYEAGNIAAANGKTVLQVLTDPHVRPQYLDPLPPINPTKADKPHAPVTFAVFDRATKKALFRQAKSMDKQINPDQVVVTGPPVDPRLRKLRLKKSALTKKRPVNIAITTGGLGTNLSEIKQILDSFTDLVSPPGKINLFLYAGTHRDFRTVYEDFAAKNNLRIGNLDDINASVRILYEDSLVDANENLIKYMFPWADAVLCKPSGDMAYDAAVAGCIPIFLEPWGEWEQEIQNRFLNQKIAFDLQTKKAGRHLSYLIGTGHLNKAAQRIKHLPKTMTNGSANIVRLHQKLSQLQ